MRNCWWCSTYRMWVHENTEATRILREQGRAAYNKHQDAVRAAAIKRGEFKL